MLFFIMKHLLFGLIGVIFFMGCCGLTTSTLSSTCPYGTYGETCSLVCEKMDNMAFSDYPDPNCYSTCLETVKEYNYNTHFSTCCKKSAYTSCYDTCNQQLLQFKQTYGSNIMDETDEEFMEPCIGECIAMYQMYGINSNSVCDIFGGNFLI